jgi:hypothetical protein
MANRQYDVVIQSPKIETNDRAYGKRAEYDMWKESAKKRTPNRTIKEMWPLARMRSIRAQCSSPCWDLGIVRIGRRDRRRARNDAESMIRFVVLFKICDVHEILTSRATDRFNAHLAKNASISSMISTVFPPSRKRVFQSSTLLRTEKIKASIAFRSSKNRVRRVLNLSEPR